MRIVNILHFIYILFLLFLAVSFKIDNLILVFIALISFCVLYYALSWLFSWIIKWNILKRLLLLIILFVFAVFEFLFLVINDSRGRAIEDIEKYDVAYESMRDSSYCQHLPEDITDFNVLDFYYYPYDGEEVKLYVSASEKVIKEYVDYLSENAIWQGSLSNRQLNNMSNFSIDSKYAIGNSDNKNTVIYILHRDYQKKTIEYIAVDEVQKEMLFFCEKRNY